MLRGELNSMADRLCIFATSPTRQILPQTWPNCTFQYLYCPHIPDNVELWYIFTNDEGVEENI
jgi:hypothetical protein